MNHEVLKARHRELRETLPKGVDLRVYRALSWLKAADASESFDAKFIFLWIAFNAVYAQEFEPGVEFSDKGAFQDFLARLIQIDDKDMIYDIVWMNFPGKIRLFIDNPYVSRHFWDFHNGHLNETEWKRRFAGSRRAAQNALTSKDTVTFFGVLFDRLYMLRNQLIHGGATWESSMNRDQVCDGARILEELVPAIIHLVLENPNEPWGTPCFPPIEP